MRDWEPSDIAGVLLIVSVFVVLPALGMAGTVVVRHIQGQCIEQALPVCNSRADLASCLEAVCGH